MFFKNFLYFELDGQERVSFLLVHNFLVTGSQHLLQREKFSQEQISGVQHFLAEEVSEWKNDFWPLT